MDSDDGEDWVNVGDVMDSDGEDWVPPPTEGSDSDEEDSDDCKSWACSREIWGWEDSHRDLPDFANQDEEDKYWEEKPIPIEEPETDHFFKWRMKEEEGFGEGEFEDYVPPPSPSGPE